MKMEAGIIVKTLKRIAIILFVPAMILASSLSAYAIGFDTEEVYNSVFVVYSGNSMGSGFAIGENCIITNAHVINNQYDVRIETYSGEIKRAFIVSMDERIDIAVIGVPDGSFTPLHVADLSKVNVGDDVYAIGAPNSLAFTLTKGVVSSKERLVSRQKYIQTDAAINTGNSGGPLLNDAGEVIGVNSYKMSDSEGIGLAIPIDVVVSFLETGEIELNESGNVIEPVVEEPQADLPVSEPPNDGSMQKPSSVVTLVLAICLVISVGLNIALIIILVFQKKKNQYVKTDPSERTDFDIEILD